MNEQENTQLVKRVYEMFKTGDVEGFLNMFSDDVSWETPVIENTPFNGKITGKENLVKWLTAYTAAEEMTVFEQDEFIAQGDRVVMLGHCETRTKTTNKEFATKLVHIMTVKDGKVTGFLELFDTAAVEKAYTAAAQAA
jgi:ketosteroid isomerase-like protein